MLAYPGSSGLGNQNTTLSKRALHTASQCCLHADPKHWAMFVSLASIHCRVETFCRRTHEPAKLEKIGKNAYHVHPPEIILVMFSSLAFTSVLHPADFQLRSTSYRDSSSWLRAGGL